MTKYSEQMANGYAPEPPYPRLAYCRRDEGVTPLAHVDVSEHYGPEIRLNLIGGVSLAEARRLELWLPKARKWLKKATKLWDKTWEEVNP